METGGLVHLWWAPAIYDARALDVLSEEERRRQGAFRFERDRASYIAAHALTRRALSSLADIDPRHWRFERSATGKPQVANRLGKILGFNLSHTRGLVACAAGWNFEIGVDVERIEAHHPPAFFDNWTLREAYLKGVGTGLSGDFERMDLGAVNGGWRFFRARATRDHSLAVVARRL